MKYLINIQALPIRYKILLAIIGTSMIVATLSAAVYVLFGWHNLKANAKSELQTTALIFSENISAALSFGDTVAANQLLNSLRALPELELACLYAGSIDTEPRLFTGYHAESTSRRCREILSEVPDVKPGAILHRASIRLGEEEIGHLVLTRSTKDLVSAVQISLLVALVTVFVSSILAFMLNAFFRGLIEDPIQKLVATTQHVSNEADFTIRAEKFASDEIGTLFDSFNNMLSQIQFRDEELKQAHNALKQKVAEVEAANSALSSTLARLKETQEQLVHQEKMASLGGLVAGVAHEINTPIGVGVTAASTLQSATQDTHTAYDEGRLSESGLRKYLQTALQSANILMTNLNRAASLIHSFKQVAVDQTSSEIRQFNVRSYLDEILLSLRPKLKNRPISVVIDVPDAIEISSYPGAFSQIITNLVMNSLIHAFPEGSSGSIKISIVDCDENLTLHYRDDGVGMSREDLQRVFDPFFTTRRGSGGSGLGMHIVYNLITQQLHGKISIDSVLGEGVHVVIQVPRKISVQELV